MKKIILPIALFSVISFISCGSGETEKQTKETLTTEQSEPICFYEFDAEAATSVKWTAFKTEAKVGVGGQFDNVTVTAGTKSTKITDILEEIKFSIKTASTNTNNEARDKKIINSFFGTMASTDLILGQVKSAEGDNKNGKCTFLITMNDVEKEAVLNYSVEDNVIKLTGEIDINNWNGKTALDALNKVCSAKHKGEGNKSITWPNVELTISTALKKDCH